MVGSATLPGKFRYAARRSQRKVIRQNGGDIFYIGGADVLPVPLENEAEAEAIGMLGTEREKDGREVLIEHNLRLVVYIARKFDNTGIGVEDLISIGTIGLIKAIRRKISNWQPMRRAALKMKF